MVGRPWKYRPLIQTLKDDELYNTSKVVRHGEALGLFDVSFDDPERQLSGDEKRRAMKNARSALANMVVAKLPEPDGEIEVTKPYRSFYPAWYGHTWKKVLGI